MNPLLEIYRRRIQDTEMIAKIQCLSIHGSGIDDDGDCYVELDDGTVFFGHQSPRFDRVYRRLPKECKTKLRPECIQVASDIVVRYVEGGLRYGGPLKQMQHQVQSGQCVAEMGAYEGFYTIKLAQQTGSSGRVLAIEPIPDNFRLLRKNCDRNGCDWVTVINRAVWDEDKVVHFQRRTGDHQSSSIEMKYRAQETFEVQAETLDAIFSRCDVSDLDFMIVQLNGAEINAFRGLTRFDPRCLSIAARYDTEDVDAARSVSDLLEQRGYNTEIVDENFVFAKRSRSC